MTTQSWTVLIAVADEEAPDDVLEVWNEVDDDWGPLHDEDLLDPVLGPQAIGQDWGAGMFILLDNQHGGYLQVVVDEEFDETITYSYHA